MYVASVASRYVKSRSGVASHSLLAFGCLASVSPPSLGTGWAYEPEAQSRPPSLLDVGGASWDGGAPGTGRREYTWAHPLLFHYVGEG